MGAVNKRLPGRKIEMEDGGVKYTQEVELPNGHKWRQRADGGWFRFSKKTCYPITSTTPPSKINNRNSYKPGARSSDVKKGPNIKTKSSTEMVSEWRRPISKNQINDLKNSFLGDNFVKVDKGKWMSIDGKRLFRVVPEDFSGTHGMGMPTVPGQGHVHLEFLRTTPAGNFVVTKNVHIPLIP